MENIKTVACKIKYFTKHYEDCKENLVVEKFNKEGNFLLINYKEYTKMRIITEFGIDMQNFKNTQFKLKVTFNQNFSKITNINFFDKNEKIIISVNNKSMERTLISKLEKDLKKIGYINNGITNELVLMSYKNAYEQMDIIDESEELSLLEDVNDYITNQLQSKHRTFKK